MLSNGSSVGDVCKEYGKTREWVLNIARTHKLSVQKEYHPSTGACFKILYKLLQGITPAEVAREVVVSHQRVSEVKKQAQKAGFVIPRGAVDDMV